MDEILKALDMDATELFKDFEAFHGPTGQGEAEEAEEPKYKTGEERLLYRVLEAQGFIVNEIQELKEQLTNLKDELRNP